MTSLQIQYKIFLDENPTSVLTFDEWKDLTFYCILNTINSMEDDLDLDLLNGNITLNDIK